MNELRFLTETRHDHEIESEFLDPQDLSAGQEVALEVLLVMADADARWGDYASAVRVLDSVLATFGALPADYALRRRRWANLAGIGPRVQRAAA
ncbi:MAG: hypothetical protein QOI98_878 [Solirubrobacteraceae bacterium]|nr:hypothetical protein [Solirubrobacteraceae bacterium]